MLSHIYVGSGVDCTTRELVETVAKVVNSQGQIEFDTSRPDGAMRKLMNVERLASLGWLYRYHLEERLKDTYSWFLANQHVYRGKILSFGLLP